MATTAQTTSFFNQDYYLNSKLVQLQATGQTQYTNIQQVNAAIVAAGYTPLTHFLAFSLTELTSPSQYFNTQEYMEAKAAALNTAQGVTTWNAQSVAVAFQQAGFTNAYAHYAQYGWLEGINPSNAFSTAAYLQTNATAAGLTVAQVTATYQAQGFNPLTQYASYGQSLGYAVTPAANPVPPYNPGIVYTLTTDINTFGNSQLGAPQVFNSAPGTFTAFDALTGGTSGNDVFNIAANAANAYTGTPVGATVTGIETVNLTSSGAAATITTAAGSGFTGVTALNVNQTGGNVAATAAGTTAITLTNAAAAATTTTVNGGSAVGVTVTGATTGTVAVGGTTPSTGAVTVNYTSSQADGQTSGTIGVTGGTTVSVTSNLTNAVATTNTVGAITVTGTTATTAVTVSQTGGATAAAGVQGVTNGAVTINGDNSAVRTITLTNYANSTAGGGAAAANALTNLNLASTGANASGTFGVTTNVTTLALGLGGGTLGAITFTGNTVATLNVALTANTTTSVTDTGLRTINLSGTGVLTYATINAAVTSITATGAAGLNSNVSGANGLTTINLSTTSANNTLTIAAATQAYQGGSGNDIITISANPARAITGGTGVDTIVLNANATTFTGAGLANVTGFETVGFNTGSQGTYNLATLGLAANATQITLAGDAGAALTVSGLAAGTNTFNINALQTNLATFQYASTAGVPTAVTANLGVAGGGAYGSFVFADANAVGASTINLVAQGSGVGITHTLAALDNTATSNLQNLAITGVGTVVVTAATTANTTLTISDNSNGTTGGSITTLTSQGAVLGTINYSGSHAFAIGTLADSVPNLVINNANTGTAGVLTIGGGAAHADNALVSLTLNGSVVYTGTNNSTNAATLNGATDNSAVNVTWNGATGVKTITLGNGNNTIVTGGAADVITVGSGTNSITAAAGADAITLGSHATTVVDTIIYSAANQGGATLTVGAGGTLAAGDLVTGFQVAADIINVNAATPQALHGATAGALLNQINTTATGNVYVNTSSTLGGNAATVANVSALIGSVTMADLASAIVAIQTNAGSGVWDLFQITAAGAHAGVVLTGADTISLVGQYTTVGGAALAAANFTA